jgi:hypothetical protein
MTGENTEDQIIEVPVELTKINVTITDPERDNFDWSIETSPDVGSTTGTSDTNGNKILTLYQELDYDSTYTWYVNATDSGSGITTEQVYEFTTEVNLSPVFSLETPVNNSIDIPIDVGYLNVTITDPEGDNFDWSIETSPDVGSTTGTLETDGEKSLVLPSNLEYWTTYKWFVNATDAISGKTTSAIYEFTTEQETILDWPYYRGITINHDQIQEDLENFPVLISIEADADLSAHAFGDDIYFNNADNSSRYHHEIETFDKSTGKLIAWVNITSLSSTQDTTLWMRYGNSSCPSQENVQGVWGEQYQGVWHLHDDFIDSTVQGNDATNSGSTDIAGFIGDGQSFDGNDYITAPDHCFAASTSWTASTWFISDATSTYDHHYLFSTGAYDDINAVNIWHGLQGSNTFAEMRAQILDSSGHEIEFGDYSGNVYTDNDWHLIHVTWNATSHEYSLYIDGALEVSEVNTNVDTGTGTANDLHLGARTDHNSQRFLIGNMDEIRIQDTDRQISWILAEYTNQQNPDTFTNIGVEHVLP